MLIRLIRPRKKKYESERQNSAIDYNDRCVSQTDQNQKEKIRVGVTEFCNIEIFVARTHSPAEALAGCKKTKNKNKKETAASMPEPKSKVFPAQLTWCWPPHRPTAPWPGRRWVAPDPGRSPSCQRCCEHISHQHADHGPVHPAPPGTATPPQQQQHTDNEDGADTTIILKKRIISYLISLCLSLSFSSLPFCPCLCLSVSLSSLNYSHVKAFS